MIAVVEEGSSLDDLFSSVDELAAPEPKTPTRAGKTVLVVDDSEIMRMAVTTILIKSGHHVIEAANGNEALHACQHNTPDLIFLDWIMPEKSGLETLKELRAMPNTSAEPRRSRSGFLEDDERRLRWAPEAEGEPVADSR